MCIRTDHKEAERKKRRKRKLSNLHIFQAIQFTSHTKETSSFLPLMTSFRSPRKEDKAEEKFLNKII